MTDPYMNDDRTRSDYSADLLGEAAANDAQPSTKDTARQEAGAVAGEAKDKARGVAQTAKSQGKEVAGEAQVQAKQLFSQAKSEAYDQAGQQQQRLSQGIRALGEEFGAMAQGSRESDAPSGTATNLSRAAGRQLENVAGWFEQREPADVLDEVRRFARRRPGTFLLGAAALGLIAGRITRSLADDARDDSRDHDEYDEYDARRDVDRRPYVERTGVAPAYDADAHTVAGRATRDELGVPVTGTPSAAAGYTAATDDVTAPGGPVDPLTAPGDPITAPGVTDVDPLGSDRR